MYFRHWHQNKFIEWTLQTSHKDMILHFYYCIITSDRYYQTLAFNDFVPLTVAYQYCIIIWNAVKFKRLDRGKFDAE